MIEQLVQTGAGLIARDLFADEDIYKQELERVFSRCWLFLAHESMISRPGDYVANYMGEDSVIVCRDQDGRVRAFLNTCRHRGNKVCLFDRGNTRTFTCSYHGWSYAIDGTLTGVPFHEEAYLGELDREQLHLAEVPRVESYGGLVFGCWDDRTVSLAEYLGDLRWYIDHLFLVDYLGGLEVLPGIQRYVQPGNWKTPADNFAGDGYHVPYAHGSSFKLGVMRNATARRAESVGRGQQATGPFEVAIAPGHGIGGIHTDTVAYEDDLALARELGAEVVDWVHERHRRLQERLQHVRAKPYGFSHANAFPNFSFNGASGAFSPRGLYLWHPRGAGRTDAWQWCAVERQAPRVVKEIAAAQFTRGQSASGLFGQDDAENFERVQDETRAPLARKYPFHYGMALGHDGRWPGSENWIIGGMPGLVGPCFSEHVQRQFYQYWVELMRAPTA